MQVFNFLQGMGSKRGINSARANFQIPSMVEHLAKYLFVDDASNENGWLRTIINCKVNINNLIKGDGKLLTEVILTGIAFCDTFDIKSFITEKYNPVFIEKQTLSDGVLKEAFEDIMNSSLNNTKSLREFLKDYINK